MAYSDNISRLSRLTELLLKLQSATEVSVSQMAKEFQVSKRTVYRDLLALEASGVPIVSTPGKGYALVEGYSIPPVMFTESEANAIIFGEKIMATTKDESLIKSFQSAAEKIKSVLKSGQKKKTAFLAQRTIIGKNWTKERTSNHLSSIQEALTNFNVLRLKYLKEGASTVSDRQVEPFAIYSNTSENWVLIAWCQWREEFRSFRLDRIQELLQLDQKFKPHQLSLEDYVALQRKRKSKRKVT